MSATVLGCGSASHLMEIHVLKGLPHIHFHFLTDKQELAELGYSKVELCCHGCGASTLMYYVEGPAQNRASSKIRDEFAAAHKHCKWHRSKNTHNCPNWRSKFSIVDIRQNIQVRPQPGQIP
jgi:hypothetical protein